MSSENSFERLELSALPVQIRNSFKHWHNLLYKYPYNSPSDSEHVFLPLMRYSILMCIISKSIDLIENNNSTNPAYLTSRDTINLEMEVTRCFSILEQQRSLIKGDHFFRRFILGSETSNEYLSNYLIGRYILSVVLVPLFGKIIKLFAEYDQPTSDEYDPAFSEDLHTSLNTKNYKNMKQLGKLFTDCSFFLELLLFFWQDYSNKEINDVIEQLSVSQTENTNERAINHHSKEINLKNIQTICENDEEKTAEQGQTEEYIENEPIYKLPDFQQKPKINKIEVRKLMKETRISGVKILQHLNHDSKKKDNKDELLHGIELFMITDKTMTSAILDMSQMYQNNRNEDDIMDDFEDSEEVNNLISKIVREEEEYNEKKEEMDELFPTLPKNEGKLEKKEDSAANGQSDEDNDSSNESDENLVSKRNLTDKKGSTDNNIEEKKSLAKSNQEPEKPLTASDVSRLMSRQESVSEIKKICKFAINSADYEDFEGCLKFLNEAVQLTKKTMSLS